MSASRKVTRARRRFIEAALKATSWVRFTQEVQESRKMTLQEKLQDLAKARRFIAAADKCLKACRRIEQCK